MTTWRRRLSVTALTISAACAANPASPDSTGSIPTWLTTLIRELEERPAANPPALIARYEYKAQTRYFVPQRCCDIMSVLYRPDGSEIIWRDTRGAQ